MVRWLRQPLLGLFYGLPRFFGSGNMSTDKWQSFLVIYLAECLLKAMGLGGWFKISFVRTWTKTLSLLKLIFPSAFFDSREIFPLRNCLPALNLCLKTGGKRSKLSIWNMCLNNWDRVFCIQPVCFSTSLPLILFTRLHPPQHPANIPGGDPQKNIRKYMKILFARLQPSQHPANIPCDNPQNIFENIWKYLKILLTRLHPPQHPANTPGGEWRKV